MSAMRGLAPACLIALGGTGVLGLQGDDGSPLPAAAAAAGPASPTAALAGTAPPSATLRSPEAFAHIRDDRERARQLFTEMGRVLRHPRCVNCHPSGERPLQGEEGRPHEPRVVRGAGGMGLPGMTCTTCHASENVQLTGAWSMPGHPNWHLAPASMAWAGRSLGEICAQLKDPRRNGELTLEELVHHLGEDGLVGWAWQPGAGREPAPGTQEELGDLARAWVDAGADCPADEGD